ncbi:MAG: ACT domain-containing protein [Longimicrobiaceae bacterium]
MYILGSMIALNDGEARVPVPWWHRAPLGFETGTQVYVSVTESHASRPGDLLVSVMDPNQWSSHLSISCLQDDRPGVIEEAFRELRAWNIALAETVTVGGGKLHHVDLICERVSHDQGQDLEESVERLRETLQEQFAHVRVHRFEPFNSRMEWSRLGRVENGWVTFQGQMVVTWRDTIARQLRELGATEEFDTRKLVLSADTSGRLFRGVVPRKGALMVSIEHADKPGVLRQLAGVLREAGVNVLSSLLKRGGAAPRNAILVAVCEPARADDPPLEEAIQRALKGLPQDLRPDWKITESLDPESVIYSRHPDDVVAHVPNHLRARVVERRSNFSRGKLPVFLSRRFLNDDRARQYAETIREVFEAAGCVVVEAEVLPGEGRTSFEEVSAAMWAARAGVVLGVEPDGQRDNGVAFGLNLAHEFGFMQGQGKPVLLLVEGQAPTVERELDAWSNIKGVTVARFLRDHAADEKNIHSIGAQLRRWLATLPHRGP